MVVVVVVVLVVFVVILVEVETAVVVMVVVVLVVVEVVVGVGAGFVDSECVGHSLQLVVPSKIMFIINSCAFMHKATPLICF